MGWALAATFAKDGQSMKVDFSPKGGPKDVTGTWNGEDGITFPDGNTWAKLESTNLDTKAPLQGRALHGPRQGGLERRPPDQADGGLLLKGWPEPEREKKEQKGRGLPPTPKNIPPF